MKTTLSFSVLFCITIAFGCQQHSKLGQLEYMPKNWLTVKTTAWQVTRLANEHEEQYYVLFGSYKPATQEYVNKTIQELNRAYLDLQYSDKAIFANLTPNMGTLSETHAEIAAGAAIRENEHSRMFKSDVRNALLLDNPSRLNKLH
jgi:hypothetical protein